MELRYTKLTDGEHFKWKEDLGVDVAILLLSSKHTQKSVIIFLNNFEHSRERNTDFRKISWRLRKQIKRLLQNWLVAFSAHLRV